MTRQMLILSSCHLVTAASDSWNNTHRLAIRHGRLHTLKVADVLIADVDIYETAQLALLVVELLAKLRVLLDQTRQQLTDRPTRQIDTGVVAGILAQRGGDGYRYCHISS